VSLASRKSEVDVRTPIKSKKLEGLLKELAGLSKQYDKIFRKAKVIIPEIFEQGKKDGFTDLEIGDMLRAVSPEMMGLQARQLRNLLAATAKHSEKIRVHAVSKQLVAPTIHVVKEDKSDQSDKSISYQNQNQNQYQYQSNLRQRLPQNQNQSLKLKLNQSHR
jgi:hypothetical protein